LCEPYLSLRRVFAVDLFWQSLIRRQYKPVECLHFRWKFDQFKVCQVFIVNPTGAESLINVLHLFFHGTGNQVNFLSSQWGAQYSLSDGGGWEGAN
jgi:hypothetical protein